MFNPGLDIKPKYNPLGFEYGEDVFGPSVENRTLDSIRKSLLDFNCDGPQIVYSIAMDVGKIKDKDDLLSRNLLYGVVTYAKGKLGKEPIRSQGHVHGISSSCNSSTPELYEIFSGEACIYMQEYDKDNPGRCFAVFAKPGDKVLVPPYWVHATINADPNSNMSFGAWCVRDYCFDYTGVRKHNGIAYFPIVNEDNSICFIENKAYKESKLVIKTPREYSEFNITNDSIYSQYEKDHNKFDFVKDPNLAKDKWINFIP